MPADPTRWLLTEGSRAETPDAMLEGLCLALRAAGVSVERGTFGCPLLHPIAQSAYAKWELGIGHEMRWYVWTPEVDAMFRRSPIAPIYDHGEELRLDLADPAVRDRFPIAAELAAEGFSAYLAIPLKFTDGSFKAFTVATRRTGGFSAEEYRVVADAVPAITVVLEGFVARRTARTLLETYIGARAGGRVLEGEIKRGDGTDIDATILFTDIRGFTGLARRHQPAELLRRLNMYFQVVVDAVAAHGGETLKFIGDSVLAIFPLDGDPSATIRAAEDAALAVLAARDGPGWPEDVDFGVALNRGTVFYGNVGGQTRLDFTVIGEAVNVANRIEGLCGPTGERFLVSQAIAEASARSYEAVGDFALKGVAGEVQIFRLAPRAQGSAAHRK